jgi:glycosyltransferase involved in cell wall biosynthesis
MSIPISIIIPIYNEGPAIRFVLDDITRVCAAQGYVYEIIIVDDASIDDTPQVLAPLHNIQILRNQRNLGYGASLKRGIRHCRHETMVILDGDNTYPASMLPLLIAAAAHYDMVICQRDHVSYQHLDRIKHVLRFMLFAYASFISGRWIKDLNSGMRLFKKSLVIPLLDHCCDTFSFTSTMTVLSLRHGHRIEYLPCIYHKRIGKSKVSFIRHGLLSFFYLTRIGIRFAPARILIPLVLAICGIFWLMLK